MAKRNPDMKKDRLCIYLVYDRDGIIDRYIEYMLRELKTCADIAIVFNGEAVQRGMEYILPYADHVFYRSNLGYDAGGFKDALCRYIGWEEACKYDELILANDSMFGPFIPMKQIFSKMDSYNFDFWGITKHGAKKDRNCTVYEHIQTYFMVAGTKLLHAREFREYWEAMPYYSGFNEVVSRHEIFFTRYFNHLGFRYGCYADMKPNDSENCRNNYMQYGFLQYELIKKRNFPFLKKKPVTFDTLDVQTQENWRQAFDYIDQYTDYDVDMIWENLIRTVNMADLQRNLHLEFIIPCKPCESDTIDRKYQASVFIFAEHEDAVLYVLEYISALSGKLDIHIFSHKEEVVRLYRAENLQAHNFEKEELHEWLYHAVEYPYVCFIKDYDLTSDHQFSCTGKSLFYNVWHNLLADYNYVCHVIDCFEENPRLGGMAPASAEFSDFFGRDSREWESLYPVMEQELKAQGINCVLEMEKMPFTVSENIWIRGNILKRLSETDFMEKDCLPYIWTFVVQSMGYYAGVLESDSDASMSGINRHQIVKQVRKLYGRTDTFLDLQKNIFKGRLTEFCCTHRSFYIYGTGVKAQQYLDMLPDVAGYIVSDGQPRNVEFEGKKVFYLSEIIPEEELGVIVCMDERNQRQVIPLLEAQGLHYLCI